MKIKKFTDTSIFQAILQYLDDREQEWRIMINCETCDFYESNGFSFIKRGTLSLAGMPSFDDVLDSQAIEVLHKTFIKRQEFFERNEDDEILDGDFEE